MTQKPWWPGRNKPNRSSQNNGLSCTCLKKHNKYVVMCIKGTVYNVNTEEKCRIINTCTGYKIKIITQKYKYSIF